MNFENHTGYGQPTGSWRTLNHNQRGDFDQKGQRGFTQNQLVHQNKQKSNRKQRSNARMENFRKEKSTQNADAFIKKS
ncbi:unnamed protein product, partial [Brenthis ino]